MSEKKCMREIVGDILIDIADIIMTVNVCKKSWGEVPLPDSLRQYYEEKAKQEDEE